MKKLSISKKDELIKKSISLKRKTIVELSKLAKKEKVGMSVIIRNIVEEYFEPQTIKHNRNGL